MTRIITVGAAQLGPIQRAESRETVVSRMLALMEQAHAKGVDLIVFPELALTTFFPRMMMEDQAEVDAWFESEMPNGATRPLFDAAREYRMGFHLGFAELIEEDGATHRYNTAILVDRVGKIVAKYRKIHLPGHGSFDPDRKFQHLEKRYFEVGNLGWPVWRTFGGILGMAICNDRRWPETYRVMGLQGVEITIGGDRFVCQAASLGDDRAGRGDDGAAPHEVVAVLAARLGDADHPGGVLIGPGLHG